MKAEGASAAEIRKQVKQTAEMMKLYKNPLFNIVMTYMEILPVGLVITLIASMILKRKPVLHAGSVSS